MSHKQRIRGLLLAMCAESRMTRLCVKVLVPNVVLLGGGELLRSGAWRKTFRLLVGLKAVLLSFASPGRFVALPHCAHHA